jgi:hypothetical protein
VEIMSIPKTFEEWMRVELARTYARTEPRGLDYSKREHEVMREAWQAGRRAAIDECAEVVKEENCFLTGILNPGYAAEAMIRTKVKP